MEERLAVQERPVAVTAGDGYPLAVTHYGGPNSDKSSGVVLLNLATAVPQSFYGECARFFAQHGYQAYTYTYRGIRRSAPDSLRGFSASVQTWAEQDIPAVVDFVRERHPDSDFTYFAHSIGGQILAYCIADDDWGTRNSVQAMVSRYTASDVEYRDIQPSEFGFSGLGHFGYFKRGRESLWQDALDWIQNTQSTVTETKPAEIDTR